MFSKATWSQTKSKVNSSSLVWRSDIYLWKIWAMPYLIKLSNLFWKIRNNQNFSDIVKKFSEPFRHLVWMWSLYFFEKKSFLVSMYWGYVSKAQKEWLRASRSHIRQDERLTIQIWMVKLTFILNIAIEKTFVGLSSCHVCPEKISTCWKQTKKWERDYQWKKTFHG